MVKIFVPNISNTSIGGGFTFKTNFVKALNGKVQFVDRWQDCDVVFVFSITTIDKGELHEAIRAGKKLVLRVDNIPRKSRNKRQSPAERLAEFGKLGMVIYQSEWAKAGSRGCDPRREAEKAGTAEETAAESPCLHTGRHRGDSGGPSGVEPPARPARCNCCPLTYRTGRPESEVGWRDDRTRRGRCLQD